MTKIDFLQSLRRELHRLKAGEQERFIQFYMEMIDDRVDGGMSEEEAVASLETPQIIAAKILTDAAEQGTLKPKRSKGTIALLVLGSPLWLPLLLALGAVLLTLYLWAWVLIISLFAAELALACGGLMALLAPINFFLGYPDSGWFQMGGGLISAALALLLFFPIVNLAKLLAVKTGAICRTTWNKFYGKVRGY